MRLGKSPCPLSLHHHMSDGLLSIFTPAVAMDQVKCQIRGPGRPCAGDTRPGVQKYPVSKGFDPRELIVKFVCYVPMHAGRIALHQPRPRNVKCPGTEPDQGDTSLSNLREVLIQPLGLGPNSVTIPTANRYIIDLLWIDQWRSRCNGQPATGRNLALPHNLPTAGNLPAAAAMVSGKADRLDESGEGVEGEAIQQQKPDAKFLFSTAHHIPINGSVMIRE